MLSTVNWRFKRFYIHRTNIWLIILHLQMMNMTKQWLFKFFYCLEYCCFNFIFLFCIVNWLGKMLYLSPFNVTNQSYLVCFSRVWPLFLSTLGLVATQLNYYFHWMCSVHVSTFILTIEITDSLQPKRLFFFTIFNWLFLIRLFP